jgi:hypothetical protein
VFRGDLSASLATSAAGIIAAGNSYFVEMRWVLSDTVGEITVNVDGVQVINVTGVDTLPAGAGAWSIPGLWFQGTTRMTDVYVMDHTGGTDFIGRCQSDYHKVNANGTASQWTRSAGSNNFENVDEDPSDGDATYNFTTTVGNQDLMNVEQFKYPGSLFIAVSVDLDCRKVESGDALLRARIRSGGSNFDASGNIAPSANQYLHIRGAPMMTDPGAGPGPWTEGNFNNLEAGYIRQA